MQPVCLNPTSGVYFQSASLMTRKPLLSCFLFLSSNFNVLKKMALIHCEPVGVFVHLLSFYFFTSSVFLFNACQSLYKQSLFFAPMCISYRDRISPIPALLHLERRQEKSTLLFSWKVSILETDCRILGIAVSGMSTACAFLQKEFASLLGEKRRKAGCSQIV